MNREWAFVEMLEIEYKWDKRGSVSFRGFTLGIGSCWGAHETGFRAQGTMVSR